MLSLSRGNNLSTVSMKKENLTPCGHCLSHLDVYNKILHQCLCVVWHTPPNLPWLKTWPISFLFNLQKKDWTYIPRSLLNDQSNHTAGRKFKRHLLQQNFKRPIYVQSNWIKISLILRFIHPNQTAMKVQTHVKKPAWVSDITLFPCNHKHFTTIISKFLKRKDDI